MWKVFIEQDALKFLESLEYGRRNRIRAALLDLKESPYPGQGRGDKKEIKASAKSAFRLRIGDHRAFYVILEDEKTVKITELVTAEMAHKKYSML